MLFLIKFDDEIERTCRGKCFVTLRDFQKWNSHIWFKKMRWTFWYFWNDQKCTCLAKSHDQRSETWSQWPQLKLKTSSQCHSWPRKHCLNVATLRKNEFNGVVHLVCTVSPLGYSYNFTLKIKHDKNEKTTSYSDSTLVHNALINRCCDDTKVCNEMIDGPQHQGIMHILRKNSRCLVATS